MSAAVMVDARSAAESVEPTTVTGAIAATTPVLAGLVAEPVFSRLASRRQNRVSYEDGPG